MKETNTRTVWMDNARVVATFAVIMVHMATPLVFTSFDPHGAGNLPWWIGNVYDSACRFCVPVFVMLTGALLLPQTISLNQFLKKRFNRILLPFVLWSLVYIAFNLALKIRDNGAQIAFEHLPQWLFEQIVGGAAAHLWYVYMILALYLFIPIVQPWVVAANNKALLYFLGLWLISVLYHQQKWVVLNSSFDLSYFSGYLGYLVLGYYIATRVMISPKIVYVAIGLFILGIGFTIAGTYISTAANGLFTHAFYEYLTLNVVMASTGIFVIFKRFPAFENSITANKIRSFISRYGYGIYLSHLLVLSLLAHFGINHNLITPVLGIPLAALVCLIISAALVYIINKLPYGKYISG